MIDDDDDDDDDDNDNNNNTFISSLCPVAQKRFTGDKLKLSYTL